MCTTYKNEESAMIRNLAKAIITSQSMKDSFYVYDLNRLKENVKQWKDLLPNVKPFYAMKCNPDEGVVKTLAEQGVGFDGATRGR